MNITNGTMTIEESRKLADYENRKASVSLSFGIEEGEDLDAVLAKVRVLATLQVATILGRAAPVETVSNVGDKPKTVKRPPTGDTVVGEAHPPVNPFAPTISGSPASGGAEGITPTATSDDAGFAATSTLGSPAPVGETEVAADLVTDDALMKACQRTTARLRDPAPTKATIQKFVDKKGMGVITIRQEKRAAFIKALDAINALDDEIPF